MRIALVLFFATLMGMPISFAQGNEELIGEGILPAIHKLTFNRYGTWANSFEITAGNDGYLVFLKHFDFRDVNKQFVVAPGNALALVLDKLFKQDNQYQHYMYRDTVPVATWGKWEFFDHNNVSLLAIADYYHEYAKGLEGLASDGIERLVLELVKEDF